ncbi:GTPase, G3E family [Lachnospiraceae bacterium XBB2008]|nr:GTPase, G3E family [Lachnospiraceae bacterium XBB2008]
MIKIDLITGFLGSGKTTFIKYYAKHFLDAGHRICILENDFGAINVDRVLLQDLLGEDCGMEMIVGGDGSEAHQRRMRTKLIAMAMSGYERIIVEPSGIFDVDELFDLLYDEPIDHWYEMGNVITIVDTGLPDDLSDESDYLLASECAYAGRLILSRTQLHDDLVQEKVIDHINSAMEKIGSRRRFSLKEDTETANWDDLTPADFERLSECGYVRDSFVKQQVVENGHFSSLFCYYLELDEKDLTDRIEALFRDPECAGVFRIKGYMHTKEGRLIRINATREAVEITDCDEVQDVLILIGEALDASAIRRYFPVQ